MLLSVSYFILFHNIPFMYDIFKHSPMFIMFFTIRLLLQFAVRMLGVFFLFFFGFPTAIELHDEQLVLVGSDSVSYDPVPIRFDLTQEIIYYRHISILYVENKLIM